MSHRLPFLVVYAYSADEKHHTVVAQRRGERQRVGFPYGILLVSLGSAEQAEDIAAAIGKIAGTKPTSHWLNDLNELIDEWRTSTPLDNEEGVKVHHQMTRETVASFVG